MKNGSLAILLVLVASGAMGQPVFQQRMVYQRPPPAGTEPTRRVAELIGRLSDESSVKRQTAARALLKMGPAVEPQLQWARQHGELGGQSLSWPPYHVPAANQWRADPRHLLPWHEQNELDVLISHLDEQRRSKISIITLHHQAALLTNVLCDLGRQADADVAVGNFYASLDWIDTNRVTVNVDRVNFWEAMRAIQQSTGLAPLHGNGQNRLVLTKGYSNVYSGVAGSVVSGPLLIVPLPAERAPSMADNQRRDTAGVKLTLQAFAEPKLSEIGPHALVRLDKCVDDRGRSLMLDGQRIFASSEGYNTWAWTVPLHLAKLEPGRRIKTLKGQFSVGLGLSDRYMTITNLIHAQGMSRELDGLAVLVKQVTAIDSQYRIDVELSAPKDSPYTRSFSASSEAYLWVWDNAQGTIVSQKVFHGLRRETEQDVGSWSLITPENGPPPATLGWMTPTETRWHTVPFELHDIVVP